MNRKFKFPTDDATNISKLPRFSKLFSVFGDAVARVVFAAKLGTMKVLSPLPVFRLRCFCAKLSARAVQFHIFFGGGSTTPQQQDGGVDPVQRTFFFRSMYVLNASAVATSNGVVAWFPDIIAVCECATLTTQI